MNGDTRYVAVDRTAHSHIACRRIVETIAQRGSMSLYELSREFHWPKPYAEYVVSVLLHEGCVEELDLSRASCPDIIWAVQ
jgi:hypothetical protein